MMTHLEGVDKEVQAPFAKTVPFDSAERTGYWTVDRVRKAFLDFFCTSHQHAFVPSSSTIPHDDPTLLFANSGMTQFKPIFQGTIDPAAPFAKLTRAANSQKCIRAGGKHNDLEDVGKDVYHHTFFEMLGNWSFGNYFKAEAIGMAWDLLTRVYAMPPERLYVTYFQGEASMGLPADEEARQLWISVGVPPERVLPFGMKENFWEMGETGPCGPCSEIHFDRIGRGRDASHLVNMDDPDVLEIWNLVFMQFNREADRSLRPLPSKHVDTGAGLERVTSVLQGKRSNYDTDVFTPIFGAIREATGVREYTGKVGKAQDVDGIDMAYRVVADHIRTLTFSISDGGLPSNEGRGYVLRRILRRAIRYAREKLGAKQGVFAGLVDTVVGAFGEAFPEVRRDPALVKQVINEEEVQFLKTLDRGLAHFARLVKDGAGEVSGADAWKLYDTYGFPLDLVKILADERSMSVDEEGYLACQEQARKQSSQGKKSGTEEDLGALVKLDVHLSDELKGAMGVRTTDDAFKYDQGARVHASTIVAILQGQRFVKEAGCEDDGYTGLILASTNMYAEEGGQTFDLGSIVIDGQGAFDVECVQGTAGYVLHIGKWKWGRGAVGDAVICTYDEERRSKLRANHTATHALNWAVKQVSGEAVDQKGSLVAPDRLRFDFTGRDALSSDKIDAIHQLMRKAIEENLKVHTRVVPLKHAREIISLRAVFGETYPDPVRVVCTGVPIEDLLADPQNPKWTAYSVELCGGTHLESTAQMGKFVICSENAIAKGVRRIQAVTGQAASEALALGAELTERVGQLEALLSPADAGSAPRGSSLEAKEASLRDLTKLIDEASIECNLKAHLRDRLADSRRLLTDAAKAHKAQQSKAALERVTTMLASLDVSPSPPARLLISSLDVADNTKALQAACQAALRPSKQLPTHALFYSVDLKAQRVYYCAVSSDPTPGLGASDVAKAFGEPLGGKSGGSAELSQGSAAFSQESIAELQAVIVGSVAQANKLF